MEQSRVHSIGAEVVLEEELELEDGADENEERGGNEIEGEIRHKPREPIHRILKNNIII